MNYPINPLVTIYIRIMYSLFYLFFFNDLRPFVHANAGRTLYACYVYLVENSLVLKMYIIYLIVCVLHIHNS